MYCKDVKECLEQVSAYVGREGTGFPLLVNTENYDDFQNIHSRLKLDGSKKCVYVSEHVFQNGLPDFESAKREAFGDGCFVLVGISQAAMLQGAQALGELLDELIGHPISGHAVILLSHCRMYLEKFTSRDIRLRDRVVFVEGEKMPLPQIKIAPDEESCAGIPHDDGIPALLRHLERTKDEEVRRMGYFTVVTPYSVEFFHSSCYDVSKSGGIYDVLTGRYPILRGATKRSYGTNEQWLWLGKELEGCQSFPEYVKGRFGSTSNLDSMLGKVMDGVDDLEKWLLWLSMKVFGTKNNHYLALVLSHSEGLWDLVGRIHMDFLDVAHGDPDFERYYEERKQLVSLFPMDWMGANAYCQNVGKHGKDAAYYLTDATEPERYTFMQAIDQYEWTDEELLGATSHGFPELSLYMRTFVFDESNTKLPEKDADFRGTLTDYFQRYKMQKIRNRIDDDFLEEVEKFAVDRPFFKLLPRSSIVSSMDKKGAQGYFFDALGVEYLAYIQAKCEEYGLICEIQVARCELPSITVKNKDFKNYLETKDIRELDDLKHHSTVYDYRTIQYPIHVFKELEIIDQELKKIRGQLAMSGQMEKAIIVSDHGASRLAVIYQHESKSKLELEEKGEHSGRCCPSAEDPEIPFAAYEDGYSVLGNYDRFKGSRMANLEVHGGASLEETLVPILTLSLTPSKVEYCFVEPVVQRKIGKPTQIELFCNVPMKRPRLLVDGTFYEGAMRPDKKHAVFSMAEVTRAREYAARIYEGDANTGVELAFTVESKTKDKNLFDI